MKDSLSVLFQDGQIIVANKPYGLLSEDDDKKPNLPALLREELGLERIFAVHRLDRTTQGLIVYAKTAEAARRLSGLILQDGLKKTYSAVAEGAPEEESGELRDLLFFDRRRNKSFIVRRERRGVKQARLYYETLQTVPHEGRTLSLLRICLLTGRTHQIRVQLASRRMPLVGDRRYGSRVPCKEIMLCSSELSFTHPFTGEKMHFIYEPTNDYFGMFR